MIYISSKFENSENRYKEVTSSMSGYQGQSNFFFFFANAWCLADSENPEMSLVVP